MGEKNSKIRVVIVNAPPLGVIEPWYDAPEFPRGALAALGGYLQSNGVEVACIDSKLERLDFEETLKRIRDFNPAIVGFTAFTNEIKPCGYLAWKVKEQLPQCITVVGGAHTSAMPEATLREFPGFDIAAIGDGEELLLDLCGMATELKPAKSIPGICFRQGSEIIRTEDRPRMLSQDSLPMPAWNLMPRANHYWLQGAKGCPFKCVFCMNHNGRVVRKRSVANVMEEIAYVIDNYAPEWIRFGDELFTADRARTVEFLQAWIKNDFGKKVKWDVQTHVKYVDRELLRLFKLANITQLDMGIESGDNDVLKRMGKATNEDMIVDAFRMAHQEGVKTGSLLLLGQPNETVESMKKTVEIAIKINSAVPMFGVMMPLPGTEVAKMAAKGEGGYKRFSTNWDEYRKNVGVSLEFSNFDRNVIDRIQFWGFFKVFLYNYRVVDLLKLIWKYRTEGWVNFKKLFLNENDIRYFFSQMPEDYEVVMRKGQTIVPEDIIESKERFNKIQSAEMKRANQLMPNLIKEQQPQET